MNTSKTKHGASTKRDAEMCELYARLMEEVKYGISGLEQALAGGTMLPGALVREFCFLQLRMVTELISLGCLTAHGDIETATRLHNEWAADKILGHLERLHPTFYPCPVCQKQIKPHQFELVAVNEGFLTKAELISLNGKSGGVLHRGSLKKLLSPRTPVQTKFPDIAIWGQKIIKLLDHHAIYLFDGRMLISMMRNSINNRVQVVLGERVPAGMPVMPPEAMSC